VPVVINDFEVLSEPQPEARKAAPEPGGEAPPPAKTVELRAIGAALRVLEVHALRIWAH
jgi:hypothetical protein